jgi:hypothetical protein
VDVLQGNASQQALVDQQAQGFAAISRELGGEVSTFY